MRLFDGPIVDVVSHAAMICVNKIPRPHRAMSCLCCGGDNATANRQRDVSNWSGWRKHSLASSQ
jgi:hypothetical protein